MNLQKITFLVFGGVIVLFFALGLLFELWKKLWLTTVGEVVSAKTVKRMASIRSGDTHSYMPGRKGGLSVTIRYRYVTQNREYFGTESKVFDVEYYKEKEILDEITQQFPVGGKIAVYHPRLMSEISSITPGGAYIMKLMKLMLIALLYLLGMYLYSIGPSL
jgi:hypothetical protein